MNSVRSTFPSYQRSYGFLSQLRMVQRGINQKSQPKQSSSSESARSSSHSKKGKYAVNPNIISITKRCISSNTTAKSNQQQQSQLQQSSKPLNTFFNNTASSAPSPYSYIDSGDFLRLEQFGPLLVTRSCPSATWPRNRNILQWNLQQSNTLHYEGTSGKLGTWEGKAFDENQNGFLSKPEESSTNIPWTVTMDGNITFTLNPSEFGQVGVFPEQLSNWQWITKQCVDHIESVQLKYPHIVNQASGIVNNTNSHAADDNRNTDIDNDNYNDNDDDEEDPLISLYSPSPAKIIGFNHSTTSRMQKYLNQLINNPKYNDNTTSASASTGTGISSGVVAVAPPCMRVLNGFAYTGGSTLAAARVNRVEVVHLDAAKSVVVTAFKNACLSGLEHRPVRYIVDDVQQFVDREIRRLNKYDGLIFDPPAFGRSSRSKHGTKSSIWKLENDLPLLVSKFRKLLSAEAKFVLLTCHDVEWPAERLAELLGKHLPADGVIEYGELILSPFPTSATTISIADDSLRNHILLGNDLPLGQYARWYRK